MQYGAQTPGHAPQGMGPPPTPQHPQVRSASETLPPSGVPLRSVEYLTGPFFNPRKAFDEPVFGCCKGLLVTLAAPDAVSRGVQHVFMIEANCDQNGGYLLSPRVHFAKCEARALASCTMNCGAMASASAKEFQNPFLTVAFGLHVLQ